MGLNIHGVRMLCYAKRRGADFARTATIGRQGLSLDKRDMARVLTDFGYSAGEAALDEIMTGSARYAEGLLRHLGAREVESVDYSAYEGASRVHDMNAPVPDDWKGRYSAVIDAGTLEHVFNFPTAIRNCMEMLRVGGHFIAITPANNFFGHGFYQFSPELFFNVFSAANGFAVDRVIAFDDRPNRRWRAGSPNAQWYKVRSPVEAGERVTLSNTHPVSLIVIARRVADGPIFAQAPQQSDYAALWRARAKAVDERALAKPSTSPLRALGKAVLPASLRRVMRSVQARPPKPMATRFEKRFFEPLDPRDRGEEA